jgi:thiamine biosynthesis protein ThiI
VASQTLENLKVIDQASPMLTLRPLIGLGKQAIVGIARQIGTFSISIQQDEDCCQLFLPRHPETRAGLEEVLAVESGLPVRAWEAEALEALESYDVFPALQGASLEGSNGTPINEDRPLVYGSVS